MKTNEIQEMKKYTNYISLGYFCLVAQDLEKMGLRNQSFPFDWAISYFPNVIDVIDKEFTGFMNYDHLSQNVSNRAHYHEDVYHFYSFHYFDKYKSLDSQYESVKNKYDRRIERFLQSIKQPTLFLRYISSEEVDADGKSVELKWIEDNYDYTISVLKRFNKDNDIVFIGDETVKSEKIRIFEVQRDVGDKVSRSPIVNNKELYPILSNVDFCGKQENILRYNKKEKKKKSIINRKKTKAIIVLKNKFCKEYCHSKTYNIIDK